MALSEEKIDALISTLDDIHGSLAEINSSLLNISNFLAVAVARYAHLTMDDTQFIKNNDDVEFGYTEALGLHCKAYNNATPEGKIYPLSEVLEDDIGRRHAFYCANNEQTE